MSERNDSSNIARDKAIKFMNDRINAGHTQVSVKYRPLDLYNGSWIVEYTDKFSTEWIETFPYSEIEPLLCPVCGGAAAVECSSTIATKEGDEWWYVDCPHNECFYELDVMSKTRELAIEAHNTFVQAFKGGGR